MLGGGRFGATMSGNGTGGKHAAPSAPIDPAVLQSAAVLFRDVQYPSRRNILACPVIHETFQAFCRKAVNHHVAVGRYVILPDHVHLFVVMPAEGIPLARWVQSLRANSGKTLLALGHAKPHWQEGFSITCCVRGRAMRKNGFMFCKIRCGQAWSAGQKIGRIKGRLGPSDSDSRRIRETAGSVVPPFSRRNSGYLSPLLGQDSGGRAPELHAAERRSYIQPAES